MPPRRIGYGQLYNYLESLGYRAEAGPTYLVYRKPGTRLPIILPKRPEGENASNFNLMSVQQTLDLDDVVGTGHLFFTIDGATPGPAADAATPRATGTLAAKPKPAGTKAAKPRTTRAKARGPE